MSWLYILTVCIMVSGSFSFFANSLVSSMYIRWLIFSCNLLSLYPAVHFLSMWLRGIIAIMNRVIVYLLGKSLLGSLFQPSFFLLLSIQQSRFSRFSRWNLWLHVIICTFWDCLLSSFAEPYHMTFCSQPRW